MEEKFDNIIALCKGLEGKEKFEQLIKGLNDLDCTIEVRGEETSGTPFEFDNHHYKYICEAGKIDLPISDDEWLLVEKINIYSDYGLVVRFVYENHLSCYQTRKYIFTT